MLGTVKCIWDSAKIASYEPVDTEVTKWGQILSLLMRQHFLILPFDVSAAAIVRLPSLPYVLLHFENWLAQKLYLTNYQTVYVFPPFPNSYAKFAGLPIIET